MKWKIKAAVMVAGMLISLGFPAVARADTADGDVVQYGCSNDPTDPGCSDNTEVDAAHSATIQVRRQDMIWSDNITWNVSDTGTNVPMKITVHNDYWYWPHGDAVDKVAVYEFIGCYKFTDWQTVAVGQPKDGERAPWVGQYFSGVKINVDYNDDTGTDQNPDPIEIPYDPTSDENCVYHSIPVSNRKWLRMDSSAQAFNGGSIDRHLLKAPYPDQTFRLKWNGNNNRYFNPTYDNPDKWPNGDYRYTTIRRSEVGGN